MTCANCRRAIDEASKVCPFCGANPSTGEKAIDLAPIVESQFPRRADRSATESFLEFLRRRQWILITLMAFALLAVVLFTQRMIRERNVAAAAEIPAVPLTEIADLSGQTTAVERAPIPNLEFQYEGNPKSARTLLMEPGAVAPPPPPTATTTTAQTAAPASTSTASTSSRSGPPLRTSPATPQGIRPPATNPSTSTQRQQAPPAGAPPQPIVRQ